MRSSSRSAAPFLSAISLVFALAAAGLVLNLTEKIESGKEATIGTIVYRQRRAERKFIDQVVWGSLQQNSPVFNRDTIRTASDSAATVYLDDGTRIDMDEETMILVSIGREESRLDVSGGTVAVFRQDKPRGGAFPAEGITIATKQGSVLMEEGSLALRDDGERTALSVSEGSARLSTASGVSVLRENQAAAIGMDGAAVEIVPLAQVSPAEGAELYRVSQGSPIDFEWIGPEGFAGSLVIATDPDFCDIVLSSPVSGSRASVALAEGSYYWRVVGKDQWTKTRRLTVSGFIAPELAYALPRLISYRGEKPPLVDLSWLPAYPRTGYLVEVSPSRDFSATALSIRSNSTSISVNAPSDGEWFWRARALYISLGVETSTATSSFIVERKAAQAPVIRGKASEPIKSSGLSLLSGGTVISWDHVEGAESYIVSVAVDEAIRNIVLQKRTATSSIAIDEALSPGLYYVSVSAEESDRVSPPSAPRTLIVSNPEPISLVSPSPGATIEAGAPSFAASWRDPNGLGRYMAEISDGEGFDSVISKAVAVGTRCTLDIPEGASGTLHWRVARINDRGDRLLVSPTSSVWKPRLMKSPIQAGPRDGKAVDVFYDETIDFSWTSVEGASHYLLTLYRMLSGNPMAQKEWKVSSNSLSINDLSMLTVGSFAWDIAAFDERDSLVHGSSEPSRAYFRIVQSKEVGAPVIELPKIIFVK